MQRPPVTLRAAAPVSGAQRERASMCVKARVRRCVRRHSQTAFACSEWVVWSDTSVCGVTVKTAFA